MSLGDFRIERVRSGLGSLSLLTVRVLILEYSQLVVCEFGGFENVLRDAPRHSYILSTNIMIALVSLTPNVSDIHYCYGAY